MAEPARPETGSGRIVAWVLLGEAAIAVVGAAWMWWRGWPLAVFTDVSDLAIGGATGAALAVVNLGIVHAGPDLGPVRALRRLHREILSPLFGGFNAAQILLVSLAAGAAEELLFRGAVQNEWGLLAASVLFGLVHIGGADMVAFGVWAASVGALLGWLALSTGGLLAPMTAHALYDALALAYIVRVPARARP